MCLFIVWNWLHHDLCTCFHAILNVRVVSSFCRAVREGSWQALEWLTSGWVSSREWVCYSERGQDFLAAESKAAVSQGKLQDTCKAKVSVNRIILCFFKALLIIRFQRYSMSLFYWRHRDVSWSQWNEAKTKPELRHESLKSQLALAAFSCWISCSLEWLEVVFLWVVWVSPSPESQ